MNGKALVYVSDWYSQKLLIGTLCRVLSDKLFEGDFDGLAELGEAIASLARAMAENGVPEGYAKKEEE